MSQREEVEKLIKIISPYPVPFLYKYRSMASKGLADIFQQRKIYLCDATKFNDPFECRPLLTDPQSRLKREILLKEITRHRFPNADKRALKKLMKGKEHKLTDPVILRGTYEGLVSTVGIYCLSEKKDDLLMWSHYSDSHRGLVVEFKALIENTLFWEAFKVIYQEDYPTVSIANIIMNIGKADEFRKALLTKSSHWAYEQEWRILKMEVEGGPGYYEFSPELLTGVILGALMSEQHKKTLKHWIEGYPTKVSLYQAMLNGSRYQLDITKISEA
jgi:hypothetical protein